MNAILKKTILCIVLFLSLQSNSFAQNFYEEKRIYLLDVTKSMEGIGKGHPQNIFQNVKENLERAISHIEDTLTEIEIIPFADKPYKKTIKGFASQKDSLINEVDKIFTSGMNTNIADAWRNGEECLDTNKVNYLFILTDGLHNYGPSKTELYRRLGEWGAISKDKYYFSFYVMLTDNAEDQTICQIADSTKNMWWIRSLDIDAALIRTENTLSANIYSNKTVKVPLHSNNSRVDLDSVGISLELEANSYYSIENICYRSSDKSVSFEVFEKQDKKYTPFKVALPLSFSWNKEKYPFVFFTPEQIDFEISNQGIREITIDERLNDTARSHISLVKFPNSTYKEPFRGFLRKKLIRQYLEPTLKLPPYKWCVPDEKASVIPLEISFNDESNRAGSTISFIVLDADNKVIKAFETNAATRLKATGSTYTHRLWIKVDKHTEATRFAGRLYAVTTSVDKINGVDIHSGQQCIAEWQMQHSRPWPIVLWLLWLITLLLILALIWLLIYGLYRLISLVLGDIKGTGPDNPSKPNEEDEKDEKKKKKEEDDPKKPFFLPWVGNNYYVGWQHFGKKVMILGESHYCKYRCSMCGRYHKPGVNCKNFTINSVKAYLNPNEDREPWMNAYRKFERSLVNYETRTEQSVEIWYSLLFYNYLQVAVSGPRKSGSSEQYHVSVQAFQYVINEYQPDVIVVWGKHLWRVLKKEGIVAGDNFGNRKGFVTSAYGKRIDAVNVKHPSAGYDWSRWYEVIRQVLY